MKARIVHSRVSRIVSGPAEETTILYQSGVEFVRLTSDALLALPRLIAGLDRPPGSAYTPRTPHNLPSGPQGRH